MPPLKDQAREAVQPLMDDISHIPHAAVDLSRGQYRDAMNEMLGIGGMGPTTPAPTPGPEQPGLIQRGENWIESKLPRRLPLGMLGGPR